MRRIDIGLATVMGVAAIAVAAGSAVADTGKMNEQEIQRDIVGKRIYLQTPFGGEFPLYYAPSGKVDGSGKALGLGRFMAPTDQGRWWLSDGRLCQQWQEWYDGQRHCFELVKTSETTLYWKRDDGLEGEARIGR